MKKSDKIIGTIAVVAIISLGVYLVWSRLVFDTPKEILWIVAALFLFAIFNLIGHYFIIGLILRSRVSSFKLLAKKYSLSHSFVKSNLFIPNGKLNYLHGEMNGKKIEIVDEQFSPDMVVVAEASLIAAAIPYVPRKSLNMKTKIVVDGLNKTPKYKQSYLFYRNPFMKISQIEKFLGGFN